jgi:hypothetical protein
VLGDPFRFEIGRDPNKHLAFEYRLGSTVFFTKLLSELKFIEVIDNPDLDRHDVRRWAQHLPISCESR